MPNFATEGQKVRMKDGTMAIVKNGQLVALPAAPGAPMPVGKLSPQDQKELIKQQEGAAAGLEAKRRIQDIAPSLRRLKGGPWRGAFLDAAIPEGKGFFDTLGGMLIGGPA